jgi:hypothetical protein
MALKVALNWDHLQNYNLTPSAVVGSNNAYNLINALGLDAGGTPYIWVTNASTLQRITSDGWLSLAANGVASLAALQIPYSMFLTKPSGAYTSVLGFRFKWSGTGLGTSNNLFWSAQSNGASSYVLLTMANAATWMPLANQEYFVEFRFISTSATAGSVEIYVDGVLKTTITTGTWSYLYNGWLMFGPQNSVTNSDVVINFRDLYFVDADALGNWDSDRIGPIRTKGLPVATVSAPNYTVSDPGATGLTDPKAILNNPQAATLSPTPSITNAQTLDPLTIGFDVSGIPAGAPIKAVQFQGSFLNQQSGNGVLNPSLTDGTNTQALTQLTFVDATMRYTRRFGTIQKALDGSALVSSKLAALQLKLTPTS